jgi:hypothetical protein
MYDCDYELEVMWKETALDYFNVKSKCKEKTTKTSVGNRGRQIPTEIKTWDIPRMKHQLNHWTPTS